MKKILSLVMALAMVLGCFAMAETTSILDADMDELLVLDRESSLNDWEGEWVLVAAYITADWTPRPPSCPVPCRSRSRPSAR